MPFADIIGHDRPKRLIRAMLDADRLPHALLLTGPAQVGKTALALAVAQAANCTAERPPCGACPACAKIERGAHPDVQVIEPEGKLRVIKIETIRELRKSIAFRPYEGRTKVFVVREADRMQVQGDYAANALLKTLEEPPPASLLILTAPGESSLLPTILSRCVRVNLAPLPLDTVEQWLEDHRGLTGPRARLAAALSQGCLGRAKDVDPDDIWDLRQQLLDAVSRLESHDPVPAVEQAETLAADKDRWPDIFRLLRFYYRDLMLTAAGARPDQLVYVDLADRLARRAAERPVRRHIASMDALDRAERSLERLIRPELVWENLLLELTAEGPDVSGRTHG